MKSSQPRNFGKKVLFGSLALGGIVIIGWLAYFWRDFARIRSTCEQMTDENARLRSALEKSRSEMEALRGRINEMPSAQEHHPDPNPEGEPDETFELKTETADPKPEPNTLVLHETTIRETDQAFVARLQFGATNTNRLDDFALIVRLPHGSNTRILDLKPTGAAMYTDVSQRVSDNGLFAAFQGTPTGLDPLIFELSVSGPETATVWGTCGLESFEVDFRSTSGRGG